MQIYMGEILIECNCVGVYGATHLADITEHEFKTNYLGMNLKKVSFSSKATLLQGCCHPLLEYLSYYPYLLKRCHIKPVSNHKQLYITSKELSTTFIIN